MGKEAGTWSHHLLRGAYSTGSASTSAIFHRIDRTLSLGGADFSRRLNFTGEKSCLHQGACPRVLFFFSRTGSSSKPPRSLRGACRFVCRHLYLWADGKKILLNSGFNEINDFLTVESFFIQVSGVGGYRRLNSFLPFFGFSCIEGYDFMTFFKE